MHEVPDALFADSFSFRPSLIDTRPHRGLSAVEQLRAPAASAHDEAEYRDGWARSHCNGNFKGFHEFIPSVCSCVIDMKIIFRNIVMHLASGRSSGAARRQRRHVCIRRRWS